MIKIHLGKFALSQKTKENNIPSIFSNSLFQEVLAQVKKSTTTIQTVKEMKESFEEEQKREHANKMKKIIFAPRSYTSIDDHVFLNIIPALENKNASLLYLIFWERCHKNPDLSFTFHSTLFTKTIGYTCAELVDSLDFLKKFSLIDYVSSNCYKVTLLKNWSYDD